MRFIPTLFLLILLLAPAGAEGSGLRLHSMFGDRMVLQQQTEVCIRGYAAPDRSVTLRCSWERGRRRAEVAADSTWSIALPTPAGSMQPQWIEVSDGRTELRIADVLIGEVWLCSGQSNMEMPLRGFPSQPVDGALTEISQAGRYGALRLYDVPHRYADSPQDECGAEWRCSTPETAALFSAVAYMFGRRMTETLGVPVGIVLSCYGGSRIESWMSAESVSRFDPRDYIAHADKPYRDPCKLYNAMIRPIAGFPVRGAVWLQGESNRRNAHVYADMLRELMSLWRRDWSMPSLPFIICSIAPCPYRGEGELGGVRIVEAQQRAAAEDSAAWFVCTSDAGDEHLIHYPKKDIVAERLFCSALANVYGMAGLPSGSPQAVGTTFADGYAVVRFGNAERGLTVRGERLENFEIAGPDWKYYPADAEICQDDRSAVRVSSPHVSHPCGVRHAFSNWHRVNLYSTLGLPAAPFRSDSVRYE